MQDNKKRNRYTIYMFFAVVAIIVNIFLQIISKELMIFFIPDLGINAFNFGIIDLEMWFIFALGIGTLGGFLFKFFADKFIVFEEKGSDLNKTTKQLIIYFGLAIITTMIFWGFEILFKILFDGDWYLIGGIIGLAIGYTVKFYLDKNYVFVNKN